MSTLAWVLGAYVLGATPTGFLVARLARGIDLREYGSKSLGGTNVYRLLGWKYAIPVALVDLGKGAIPVLLGRSLQEGGLAPAWFPAALGAAAVLGHMYSPYVRFRGGKGMATATGMFLALAPLAILIAAPVWGAVMWFTGYVSASSIATTALFPLWVRLTEPDATYAFWASVALAALIVFAHRSNVRRIAAGTENRFRTRNRRAG
ncbi:MAG: glycerol-3-phosphate 1-O-acyltransferase PlsY [Anaerolineales bacterium]